MGLCPIQRLYQRQVLSSALVLAGFFVLSALKTSPAHARGDLCHRLLASAEQTQRNPADIVLRFQDSDNTTRDQLQSLALQHYEAGMRHSTDDEVLKQLQQNNTRPTTALLKMLGFYKFDSREVDYTTITPRQDREIQGIVRDASIEAIIKQRNKRNPNEASKEDQRIWDAVKKIQSRALVGPKEIEALEILRDRVLSFKSSSDHFRKTMTISSDVNLLIADYLKTNDKNFRKLIQDLGDEQKLYLSVPKVVRGPDGQISLSLDIKAFDDIDKYDRYFNEMQRIDHDIRRLHKQQKDYAEQYLFSRYFSRQLPGVTDGSIDEAVFDIDNNIDSAEHANKTQYRKIVGQLKTLFDKDNPIHPSTTYLTKQKNKINRIHSTVKLLAGATATTTLSWGAYGFYLNTKDQKIRALSEAEELADQLNLNDSGYWIKKCGSKATKDEKDACLFNFSRLLSADLEKRISSELKKNPKYAEVDERIKIDDYVTLVVNGVFNNKEEVVVLTINDLEQRRATNQGIRDYFRDSLNVFKKEYWVKKCSGNQSSEEVSKCLFEFSALLSKNLERKIQAEIAKNPDYSDQKERAYAGQLVLDVANETHQKLPLRSLTHMTMDLGITYARQIIYNTFKLSEQVTNDTTQKAPDTNKSDGSQMNLNQDEIRKRFADIKDNFARSNLQVRLLESAKGQSPKNIAKIRMNQMLYLKDQSHELLLLADVGVNDDLQKQLIDMNKIIIHTIADEMEKIINTIPEAADLLQKEEPGLIKENADGSLKINVDNE